MPGVGQPQHGTGARPGPPEPLHGGSGGRLRGGACARRYAPARRWCSRSTRGRPARPASSSTPTASSLGRAYREFTQHFPRPGWVEHDAAEIWEVTQRASRARRSTTPACAPGELAARRDHQPARDGLRLGPGDRRAAAPRARLAGPPHRRALRRAARRTGTSALVRDAHRARAGPVLLRHEDRVAAGATSTACASARASGRAVFGTIDSWLIFKLTGEHVTDAVQRLAHDALRHRTRRAGTTSCCELFGVPRARAARGAAVDRRVRHDARRGAARPRASRWRASPATSRRRCSARPASTRGMGKNTYGTGSFVLLNAGARRRRRAAGLLTTVAWRIGGSGTTTRSRRRSSSPARRCSGCATASGIIERGRARPRRSRRRWTSNDGVYFVPGADRPGLAALGPRTRAARSSA